MITLPPLPADLLKDCSLFADLSEARRQALAAQASIVREAKNKVLFLHEDDAASFYVVQSGWVKLFRETLDGDQAIIDILPRGHVFGETSLFNEGLYPYSAEVVENAVLLRIPLNTIKHEIQANPDFAFTMLKAMARYRRQQDNEIERLNLQNASQRIGCFLLRLANQKEKGPVVLHLPYDKMLVASRLGMQPETFSRALAKLKQETGIQIKGSTIEMESLNNLIHYSCSACSSGFPCKDK